MDSHQADQGVCAVDSHFHLDKLLQRTRTNSLEEAERRDGSPLDFALTAAVANFVFPELWDSVDEETMDADRRIFRSYGIHPSRAVAHPEDLVTELSRLLQHPRAVAVGEVGLDFRKETKEVEKSAQRETLRQSLLLARLLSKPVIVHCRGGPRAERECLEVMSACLDRFHRIHRHCFNGTPEQLATFSAAFPNSVFGFAGALLRPGSPAVKAVQTIPLERLVLETDAPYLVPPTVRGEVARPWMVYEVAKFIARRRGLRPTAVLDQASRNAIWFYGLAV